MNGEHVTFLGVTHAALSLNEGIDPGLISSRVLMQGVQNSKVLRVRVSIGGV